MKNKKKMGKMIALALVLGSCSANVTEAVDIYGNSSSPTFEVKPEGEVVSASNNNFAFNYDTINFNNVNNVFAGYASNADSVSNTLNFTAISFNFADNKKRTLSSLNLVPPDILEISPKIETLL